METSKEKFRQEIFSWLKTILISLIIVLIISKVLIVNANIPTTSMESTINVNDRLIANRLAYIKDKPKRNDIVIFVSIEDNSKLYVKRLIGLPGDQISIEHGRVYVNNIKLIENYLNEEPYDKSFGTFHVPKNHYFFLGDNRNHSNDSRLWDNPYISEDEIIGKIIFRYFPKFTWFVK